MFNELMARLWAMLADNRGQIPSSLTDDYDALLSTTLRAVQPRLHDNITRGNKYINWLNSRGRFRTQSGGERVRVPLMHAQNNTADIYSGYGLLDTTPQDGITTAFYEWAQLSVSITISGKEKKQNKGKSKILDLLQAKTKQSEVSTKELLNNSILSGRIVTSAAAGQFGARLGRLDSGAEGPLPLPVIIDVDSDRSVAVGNINPATYAFWRNQVRSMSGVSTFVGYKSRLNGLYNDCSRGTGGSPDFLLGDQFAWEQFWLGLASQERYMIEDKRTIDILGGSDALKFRGAVFIWDEVVPDPQTNSIPIVVDGVADNTANALHTVYMSNSDAIDYVVESETDFTTTPFMRPENQDATVAQILWMGMVGTNNRRKLGVLHSLQNSDLT